MTTIFEAGAAYRYLNSADQRNPYMDAVEANLAELGRRLGSGAN